MPLGRLLFRLPFPAIVQPKPAFGMATDDLFELRGHHLSVDLDPCSGIFDRWKDHGFEHEAEAFPVSDEIGKHDGRAGADV